MSCDAVSVMSECTTDTQRGRVYRLALKGFEELCVTYTLYVEKAAEITREAIHAHGIQIVSVQVYTDILQLTVVFEKKEAVLEMNIS